MLSRLFGPKSRITDHDRAKQALYHHHKDNAQNTEFATDEEIAIAEQALAQACAKDDQPYVSPK